MPDHVIVIDTREHEPYAWDGVMAEHRALDAGDYSVEGFEGALAVERKSLHDFVGTVIHARKRFTKELKKLATYPAACIVVEGSMEDIRAARYASDADPKSVLGLALSIITDWGIPVYFCSNRPLACWFTLEWLRRQRRKLDAAGYNP